MKIFINLILLLASTLASAQSSNYLSDFNEATRIFKERNYSEAEKRFKELLNDSLELDSVLLIEVKFGVAKAYVHQGQSAKAFPIYYEIKEDATAIKHDSLLMIANFSIATMYEFRSQYDSVEVLQWQTLGLKNIDQKSLSDCYTLMSRAKSQKLQDDSAFYYIRKAIEIDKVLSDSSSLPYNYLDLGQEFRLMNYPDSAVFYTLEGLKYLRKGKDDYKRPGFYERIGQVLLQEGNIPKAESYVLLGLEKAKELNLNVSKERAYQLLGEIKRFDGDYKNALPFYYKADSLNKITNKGERRAHIYRGITECKVALNQPPNKEHLEVLRAYIPKTQSETDKIDCELVLLKAEMNDISREEFDYRTTQLRNSEVVQTDLFYQRKFLQFTYDYQLANALWRDATYTNEQLKVTLDKISKRNTKHVVHDLEAQYKKREQDKQIEFLDSENALNAALIEEQNATILSIAIGLFLVCLLGLFLFRLLRKVRKQKEIISVSLKEKDTLLREIHHRVKNNLQVISSLLRLQSNSTKNEAAIEALKEGQSRVQSMSLIHQNLYGKDNLTGIGMKNYLEQLSQNLVATYSTTENVELKTDIADLKLDVDTVVPMGLIINELVTNCLKYAFPNGRDGKILISLKEENNVLHLSVKDNGVGFDSENIENTESFGFGLIQAFTSKLDAEMAVRSEVGTEVVLLIKEYQLI